MATRPTTGARIENRAMIAALLKVNSISDLDATSRDVLAAAARLFTAIAIMQATRQRPNYSFKGTAYASHFQASIRRGVPLTQALDVS